MTRIDGRRSDQLRPTTIETAVLRHAEGSARITMGEPRCFARPRSRIGCHRFSKEAARGG